MNEKEEVRIDRKLKKYCSAHNIILGDDNFYETCKKALTEDEYKIYFLPEKLWDKVDLYAKDGDELFHKGEYNKAIEIYKLGIKLIPKPRNDYEAKLWFTAAIADAYWKMKQFDEALKYLDESLDVAGGKKDLFIRLRRGQVFYELGKYDKAILEFKIGYKKDKDKFLEDVDEKYIKFIEDNI